VGESRVGMSYVAYIRTLHTTCRCRVGVVSVSCRCQKWLMSANTTPTFPIKMTAKILAIPESN